MSATTSGPSWPRSYLTLMSEAAPQREHTLREVFNGLRWLVRAGAAGRLMAHDLPPWGVIFRPA